MSERIIVIGASAGGVEPLKDLVAHLPSDLKATVFVVLHIAPNSYSVLPSILNRAGSLKAVHPEEDEVLKPGCIYVAPPDRHLIVKPGHIQLARGPKENNSRPAIDVLFRTAARAYGSKVIGVLLSGVLDDGTAGLLTIKQQGGVTIVQEPNEALFSDMPQSAIDNVEVDYILPVVEIAAVLVHLAHQSVEKKDLPTVSEELIMESDMAQLKPDVMQSEERPGTSSVFACPDCGGVLWEFDERNLIRFRCRTGHAYSVESLLASQSENLEEALWTALRALEETAALRKRMAERASKSGYSQRAQDYLKQAQEAKQRALVIRGAILNGTNSEDVSDKIS